MNDSYYLIVQEPGHKLVPLEGPGSDRGIFWDIADAERVAAALSVEVTQYEFHIYRVESSNDAIKDVVARYRNGTIAEIETRTGPPPRRSSGVIAIVVAAVAILGIIVAVLATHHNSVTAGSAPAQSSSASPAQTTASPAGLSWVSYQDPSGFSIKLPGGWTVSSRTRGEVDFTGQPPGFVVLVAWTTDPQPDALTDWRQQAAAKAQSDSTYQQIGIQRVTYRGYNAADWEFINVYQGALTHVIDRGFIVRPGHLAYAIEIYGPADAQWSQVYASMWTELVASFEPAT